jgi:hypothetical protein
MSNLHRNIVIAGFFDRGNLGDDLFHHVWQHIFLKDPFKKHHITFLTLDDLKLYNELETCDILILAGGDVLNYYFLSDLRSIIEKEKFTGQLYAFSVGIPYQVVIVDGLLDPFNFIMCRAKSDACSLKKRFGVKHVRYFPDLSLYLPQMYPRCSPKNTSSGIAQYKLHPDHLNVGVFLTRSIFKNNGNYEKIVENIALALDKIIETKMQDVVGFELFLIPFNTRSANIFEDDNLINKDVYKHVKNKDRIHLLQGFSVEEMFLVFKDQLDMAVNMRYHAHMYSIVTGIPFASIYTTRKVGNILNDTNLTAYGYALPVNEHDLPTDFNVDTFLHLFEMSFQDRKLIQERTSSYVATFGNLTQFEDTLRTLINEPLDRAKVQHRVYPLNTINTVIESVVRHMLSMKNAPGSNAPNDPNVPNAPNDPNAPNSLYVHNAADDRTHTEVNDKDVSIIADEIYKGKLTFSALLKGTMTDEALEKYGDFLAALSCFGLIHIPFPKYHYGMSRKILSDNFSAKSEFMWVWSDYQKNNEKFFIENPKVRKPLFDATFVGIEDFKGCHRSGWQYTLDNLLAFHNENAPLIFDNYIDRTFHWAHDVYKYTGIIPFPRQWCGFIHHTFDEDYSPFNVPNLFRNATFLKSLENCSALFTLSADLAVKVRVLLQQYGFKDVPVYSFTHPTESSKLIFTMDRFMSNNEKKVVQIGAWLRDNYAIYKLCPHKNTSKNIQGRIPITKAVLRGKHMNNYFKPDNLKLLLEDDSGELCDYTFTTGKLNKTVANKYVFGIVRAVHEEWNSVTIIDTLDNDQYDKLLSENIVFLKLLDASAVNTIIECIVRCTPVLVNRHPAVEEMLGENYPFYYEDAIEAGLKVTDLDAIRKTHRYLVGLNKKKFTMEYFLQHLESLVTFEKVTSKLNQV